LKVKRLKDLLEHADRADRLYYHAKGSYYLILAANMLWERVTWRGRIRPRSRS